MKDLKLTTDEVAALRKALDHVRVHMAHEHPWAVRDAAMTGIGKVLAALDEGGKADAHAVQSADLRDQLTRARELAAWFQADHSRTLPVVANFRLWRMGHLDGPTFHAQLRGETCDKAIALGPVAPMQALAELNDWLARKERT
jgi:hypothetical protein